MEQTTRRDLLRGGATLVAAAAGQGSLPPSVSQAAPRESGASKWDHEYTFGHTVLFMEQYHQGTMEILGRLTGETELIGELTSRLASVVRKGGTVWMSMNQGHMPHYEQSETRRGSECWK